MKFHVFSVIGSGHGAAEWGIQPTEWIAFYEHLERVAPAHHTRVWYQPTYVRRERIAGYAADGYRASCGGCKVPGTCMGGCPAEELVMGSASCASEPDIVPVCRLWKADIRTATAAVSS